MERLLSFGTTLTDYRKRAGLSQKELAQRIKKENGEPISPQYLNDLERDRRNPPSAFLLIQFAEALGIATEVLYYHAGELPAPDVGIAADEKRIVAAYSAFRNAIRGRS